ncbi:MULTISPECIES: glycosyltransferase family 2 protein [unclassified Paraburkholderia]|uniref:glycosyltransferase family 2 protein n=1 Tax=unclassified Paraburkholderia TaxID=2615204 RepID=UPI002AB0154C|nr:MULTISPECIES: glycosyltransferase [unclassified Paraburkholderia]
MTITTSVSICLPTCNRPDLLIQCIESCLAQTHTNIEIVIGDDSPDTSTARLIAQHYGHDPRVLYRRNVPALGQARNVASLFARASGDKILLIHDDDFLLEHAIARLLEQWTRHPDIDVAFGNQYEADAQGRIDVPASRRMNEAYHRTPAAAGVQRLAGRTGIVQMFPNNGWLADAALVKRIGYDVPANTQLEVCCDFVFGVRLCLSARAVCYVDDYVSCYRKTGYSVSQATRHTPSAASMAAWHFLKSLALPPELEPARRLALRRLVPIVVSLHARNRQGRAGLSLALTHLYAYRFGLSLRLYYHLLMIWKNAWLAKAPTPAQLFESDDQVVDVTRTRIP